MVRRLIVTAAFAALAACSPPAQQSAEQTHEEQAATAAAACNGLQPNVGAPAQVQAEVAAAADLPLAGGPLTPGIYDLTAASAAPNGDRYAALEVTEGANGV